MMYQQEIRFFWPLTEQIPLDLDYTGCERPSLSYPLPTDTVNSYIISNGGTWTTSIIASNLTLDVDTTTVKMKEQPGLCRRTLLKCLGLKCELK